MKIRNRLTIQFAFIVATILLLFSLAVYYFSEKYREQEFYTQLKDRALTTASLLIGLEEVDYKLQKIIDRNTVSSISNEKVGIYDSLNNYIYNSAGNETAPVNIHLLNTIRATNEFRFKDDRNEAIGVLYNDKTGHYVVIASAYDKYGIEKMKFLRWILAAIFLVCMVIAVVGGWIFSNEALRPISNVIGEVDNITASNLNAKVNVGNGTDEMAQLAITFNKMLGRLKTSFELQRNFVSNASHELRTPLTVLTGQIGVALQQERNAVEYKELLQSLLEDIRNMNNLTNHLLELALLNREVSEIKKELARIDEVLLNARSELLRRNPGYKVLINYTDSGGDENKMILPVNEQLLKTAFINLMDNACKFSNDKQVDVSFSTINHDFKIVFKDNGIGIPPEEMEHVFEPLYRSSNAIQFTGHGLGLALTQRIVQLHNGQISIHSVVHQGTTIEIILPVA